MINYAPKPIKYDQNVVRPQMMGQARQKPINQNIYAFDPTQDQSVGGFNYNPASVNGPQSMPSWMIGAISTWIPQLLQQGQFGGQMEGERQSSYLSAIRGLQPGNAQSQINMFGNRARDQRMMDARAQMPGAANLGKNYKAALTRDALNKSAGDTSNFMAQLLNPQAQAQNASMAAGLATQAQQMPILSQLLDLQGLHNSAMGTEYNRSQSSGGGIGGLLGMLGGSLLSGGKPWWLGGK